MAWPRGDPVQEIDRLIAFHRDDQIAKNIAHDQAVDDEHRAIEMMVAAQAVQARMKLAADYDAEEIERLFSEREIYVPRPRQSE